VILCDIINIGLLKRMSELFCTKCAWDIKWDINGKFGNGIRSRPFYSAVRDDPAPEGWRSDLWGLIHYGYVSAAHGVPTGWIAAGNAIGGGVQGADDNLAIAVGIGLYQDVGMSVTTTSLRRAILSNLSGWRRHPADRAVIPPLKPMWRP